MKHFNYLLLILFLSTATVCAQTQETTPLALLQQGNQRFYTQQSTHPHQDAQTLQQLAAGQNPFAVVICCSDSRVSPEILFDQGMGDLFVIRTAGNVMGDYEEGSIEYAVEHLGTRLVVVLGHTHCGAIKAYIDAEHSDATHHAAHAHGHNAPLGHIQSILTKLGSEQEMQEVFSTQEGDKYPDAIRANVVHGVKQLKESDPILSKLFQEGNIQIVGAMYNIENGKVEFLY